MDNDDLFEKAMMAINILFGDDVPREKTITNLYELRENIQILIDTLEAGEK